MKRLNILLVIFISLPCLEGYCQDYTGVKTMVQYEDTIIRTLIKYDINGNETFSMSNRMFGPVIMMFASEYDEHNRDIATIIGHSNVGFSVSESEFDSLGNEIRVYSYIEPPEIDSGYHFNPYEYIEHYRNRADLESDSFVQLIKKGERYIKTEKVYDSNGNLLQQVSYEENGDTSVVYLYEYDNQSNQTKFSYKASFLGSWDYYYKYDSNGNKISSKRVDNLGDTTQVNIYKYDKLNNLVQDVYSRKGVLEYSTLYVYSDSNLIRIESLDENNKLWRTEDFTFNSQGQKLTEIHKNIDKNTIKNYKWEYIYY